MERDRHELDRATMDTAAAELRGLFELFQDDDVLDMFDTVSYTHLTLPTTPYV